MCGFSCGRRFSSPWGKYEVVRLRIVRLESVSSSGKPPHSPAGAAAFRTHQRRVRLPGVHALTGLWRRQLWTWAIPTVRGGISLLFESHFPMTCGVQHLCVCLLAVRVPCLVRVCHGPRPTLIRAVPPLSPGARPPGALTSAQHGGRTRGSVASAPLLGGVSSPVQLSPRPPTRLHPEEGLDLQHHVSAFETDPRLLMWRGKSFMAPC